jgi:hypothetical protein
VRDRNGKRVNIQEFLQSSFLAAVGVLADAVGDLDGVLGIEVSYFELDCSIVEGMPWLIISS